MSIRTRLTILALAVPLLLGIASCGGDDDDSAEAPTSGADAALDFAQCMRDEGVEDYPDPEIADDGTVQITAGGADDPDMEAAQETCRPLLEQGDNSTEPPDEEQQAELQDQVLAFAQCMREHGIDFPDPDVDGGQVIMGAGEGVDPESPEFQDALAACQGGLPNGGGAATP